MRQWKQSQEQGRGWGGGAGQPREVVEAAQDHPGVLGRGPREASGRYCTFSPGHRPHTEATTATCASEWESASLMAAKGLHVTQLASLCLDVGVTTTQLRSIPPTALET